MKIRISILGLIVSQKLTGKKIALFVVLLLITFASVVRRSAVTAKAFIRIFRAGR